jgi:hypothetical protein
MVFQSQVATTYSVRAVTEMGAVMADTESSLWRKSSLCDSNACIEVARREPLVAVRDGKDPAGPVLIFSVEQWDAFILAVSNHVL